MPNKIGFALLIGFLALAPVMSTAAAGDSRSLEQVVIEMAHTPGDHAALSTYYRAKAADARAEAAQHEKMGRTYNVGKITQGQQMKQHCNKIAANFTSMASEYDAMAKLHDAESAKTKK